jgi:tetratricopeptide (TPR) repeat protein
MSGALRDQLQATLSGTHTLERELGGGGMSKVFIAEETRLKRKVVVKVLSPELAQGISVERFEREIQTVASLLQANIVPVISAGDTNGLPFYTMPFVTGESLRARLGRGPLAISEVVNVLRDVARALAFAHRQGVVHRDIKPDNVLLSEGAAVVTDFGIAKAISASRTGSGGAAATLTQLGTSIGTPAYMAPEQAAGDADLDHRADIYALGAMAYELLTGQVVFANRTPQRMLAAHMSETPVPVSDLRPDTPQQLADLVMRCLAKDANDRPQDATQILLGLETTGGGSMQAMPAILLGGPGMLRKALAIYAAAFVAVAILAKAAIVGIGLPDWVFPGSLIVMALGLPVVLWTGYVQRVARRAALATPTFTPGGSPATTAHGTIATMALKAAPHVSWYKTARGGMYALGAFIVMTAAFMGMRQFGIGPFGSLIGKGAFNARDLVMITDFRVTGADSTLGRVVSDAVRQGLAESSALTLQSPAALAAALGRMQRPSDSHVDLALAKEVAQREGVKAIIDGEISAVSGGYILTVRLLPADGGNPLATISAAGDGPSGLITASDRATRELRSKVGESLRRVQSTPPLQRVTTASMDALRKYSEAFRLNAADRNYPKAIETAREAIAADSTFAMAWRLLAAASSNGGRPRSEVDSAYRMAFRYRDRMSERERQFMLEGYYRSGPGRDRARAIEAGERLMALGDTFVAGNNLGLSYITRREFARADSLYTLSIQADSSSALPYTNRVPVRVGLGRFDDAETAIAIGQARFPRMAIWAQSRFALLYARDDLPGAARVLDSLAASGDGVQEAYAARLKGEVGALRGRIAEYQRALAPQTAPSPSDAARNAADEIRKALAAARLDAVARDSGSRAARRLDATLANNAIRAIDVRDRPYMEAAAVYAIAGRPDRARALLAEYDAHVRDTSLRRFHTPNYQSAQGWIALAEKKFDEAAQLFRRADQLPDGPSSACLECLPRALAVTFDAAGQPDSAIVQYERALAARRWVRPGLGEDITFVPTAYWRLGVLYDAKGDIPNATKYYRKFVELWKDADPEFQPRVADAKRRVARIAPVEGRRP